MKPAIAFIWANFGPYHVDRLEAAAAALKDTHRVIGIEIAGSSQIYPWARTEKVLGFERVTLFPDLNFESIPAWHIFVASARVCLKARAHHVFLCHYEQFGTNLVAWLLRLFGYRVHLMIESKFDDKQRFLGHELLKKLFLMPYQGALVGGERTRDYLRFFGFDPKKIHFGYDTVSMDRIRRLAGAPAAPAGIAFKDRHFTIVARLVTKKNIVTALEAYAAYRRLEKGASRQLHICGSGELEAELRAAADRLGVDGVVFRGFVQSPEVARVLSSTLALVLPSVEEQWGLVVNEALALGVPILCSANVGARDLLVRTAINGYLFEPDNPDGLARLLHGLSSDESEWRRLAEGSTRLAPLADTAQFGVAICRFTAAKTDRLSAGPQGAPRQYGGTTGKERRTQRYRVVRLRGKPIMAIPEGSRALRLAAIKKFQPYTKKRDALQKFVKAVIMLGADRAFIGAPMSGSGVVDVSYDDWLEKMRAALKEPDVIAAIVWPPQFDRRRVYVHLLRPSGEPLAFCKVALGPFDHDTFRAEIDSLTRVHARRLQHARIPAIFSFGSFSNLQYAVYEPFPDGTVPYIGDWPELSPAVFEYSGPYRLLNGGEIRRLDWWERFEQRRAQCSGAFLAQLDAAISHPVCVCRVQGDLVPANFFSHAGKLWICDWEFSSENGPYRTDELCYKLSFYHDLAISNPHRATKTILSEMGGGFDVNEFLLALAFLVGRDYPPAVALAQNWEFLEG